ncbi:MAG: hypothetical protein R3C03_16340 [Pirellulaceae bacterium]
MNSAGTMAVKVNLTGGDVTGATNDEAIYRISGGNTVLIARDGNAIGSTGFNIGDLGFNAKINSLGQIGYDTTISGTGITTANDSAWLIDNTIVLQEGTAASGTAGATFNTLSVSSNGFGANGFVAAVTLAGGDATTSNDQAIFRAGLSGATMLVREGDVAGSTGGNFGVINNSSVIGNDNNGVLFFDSLTGGSITTADDASYWFHDGSGLNLVAREGDLAPGLSGKPLARFRLVRGCSTT